MNTINKIDSKRTKIYISPNTIYNIDIIKPPYKCNNNHYKLWSKFIKYGNNNDYIWNN